MANCRVVVFIIIVLSSLLTTPAAAAIDTKSTESSSVTQTGSETVSLTQTIYQTPKTSGSVRVTTTADVSLKLKEFDLFVPESASELTTEGFSQTHAEDPIEGFKRYTWDGSSRSASVTYRLNVNSTETKIGSKEKGYATVDTGDWAIIEVPQTPYRWYASEEITVTQHNKIHGPGVIGDGFAFLGDHEIKTKTANGQEFQLVIPEAANLTADPQKIFKHLAFASKQLDVGARDKRVIMIAVPTSNDISWSHGGRARDSMFWIQDDSKLETPTNTWIHEYVHTRQDFSRSQDLEWFGEGSPSYYAALFTYQQGDISYEQFRRYIANLHSQNSSATLTDTSDGSQPQYNKGGATVASIDQRIRLATSGSASLTDLFRRLNLESGTVSNQDFIRFVGLFSNKELESDVQAATKTTDSMSMWDREGFEQAYNEDLPARESPSDPDTESSTDYIDPRVIILLISLVLVLGLIRFNMEL